MMTAPPTRLGRALLGLALAALLAAGAAGPALAAPPVTTAAVTAGTLSQATSANPSFAAALDPNGADVTATYTLPVTATDTRGSGAGWNLTITSTQFSTGGASPQTLPATASAITGVTAVATKSSYTAPTNGVTYALGVPAAPTAPTAVKLFNAAANTGMGQFTVTPTITVTVPANAYTGTYTSTLTLSIVSGP